MPNPIASLAPQPPSPLPPGPHHPVLPAGSQRGDIERLLPLIRRTFRLSDACALALLTMVQSTRPSDWTDPAADPVCHAAQGRLAARLGLSPRGLRYHEVTLERAGLLRRATGADGGRGRFAGGAVVQGLNLAPLVALAPRLLDLARAEDAEATRIQGLRRQCSAARRVLKDALARLLERAPKAAATTEALALYGALPRRYDGLDGPELDALLARVASAADAALAALEALAPRLESSGVSAVGFRRSLHATSHDESDSCIGSTDAGPRSGPDHPSDQPTLDPNREPRARDFQRGAKPGWLESFAPSRLHAAASADMRLYLDAVKGERPVPNELDLIRAALLMVPELGIGLSAWDEAADAMGDLGAALSVLVIDARRFDPVRPIRNPGGALRAFTRLAHSGRLNLAGSLIGLVRRAKPAGPAP